MGYWIFNREEEHRALANQLAQHFEIPETQARAMIPTKPGDIDDGREYLAAQSEKWIEELLAHNPNILTWVEEGEDE
jgi:hypothetical protein